MFVINVDDREIRFAPCVCGPRSISQHEGFLLAAIPQESTI